MAFCANCGAEVQGKFCAKCGSPLASAPSAAAPPPPPPPQYTAPPQNYAQPIQAPGLTDNVAAALCYVLGLVTGILFLVLAPYNQNRNIRFHAFQSIFLHVGSIALFIGLMVVTGILRMIPFLGVLISFVLYPLVGLGVFILWLLLMYKAYNNERWVLPVIGDLAEKQA
jgi:uncharacterized membrane protein